MGEVPDLSRVLAFGGFSRSEFRERHSVPVQVWTTAVWECCLRWLTETQSKSFMKCCGTSISF